MARFDGKVAIVTGAGQGLGRAYAEALAAEGASVVIAEINEGNAKDVAEAINLSSDKTAGGTALAVRTDVTDADSCEAMVAAAVERFGTVDILVNNAAIYDGLAMDAFEDIDIAVWDRVLAVNVKGTWLATRAVAPLMKEKGYGKIVNISSSVAYIGPPLLLHYVASKGAVVAMTKALAKELGDYGVRVTALAPGMTFTDATKHLLPDPIMGDMFMEMQALKEKMQPEHVVPTLLFLCSPESDFVLGQNWVVDGGMALQ
ncbi:MAG TPA: glucose 1-dehydrogenase [Acidimicrobiia bacterium]|nr:glucose 1-dehydrogenase [Acidimicrobiia bacterium]